MNMISRFLKWLITLVAFQDDHYSDIGLGVASENLMRAVEDLQAELRRNRR